MLKRTTLLEKKKKKKNELDRVTQLVKTKIEFDLKNQNKKMEGDYVDLEKLDPATTVFTISDDLRQILQQMISDLDSYVATYNNYFTIKQFEEKRKAKK